MTELQHAILDTVALALAAGFVFAAGMGCQRVLDRFLARRRGELRGRYVA